ADMRFRFINKVCAETLIRPAESKGHLRSRKIDRVLTGRFTAIPLFVLIMGLVFWLSFNVIGAFFQNLLEMGLEELGKLTERGLNAWQVNPAVKDLIINGIFAGVGSVLSFLPIIVTLFFFLSMLEDSGYMARVAFFMDKLLRKIGLSGRSIVPMLIGFGCTVPAVMSSRTLPSERDRKMTILLTPFMSCSAKAPIYAFFALAFFPKHAALVTIGLYVLGIFVGILAAAVLRLTVFRGEAVPFVMELPNYRMPSAKNVAQLLWEKAKDFLTRAFTVIFVATIVVWILQNFDYRLNYIGEADSKKGLLALLAGLIAPVFKPLGFGNWQCSTALISGFLAKESVVSTLQILFGDTVTAVISPVAAASLLVFCLLYTPCVAAVASVRRELGRRWAAVMIVSQCAIAWIVAFVVHSIGLLL
ncbi:MAG: ferrous iron transport protein B, partial [Lachnospiraceae bacterium]|nr:ferrous iron transport protein B [Lachnospiraceae bacterium]